MTDLQIARSVELKTIQQIAEQLGISAADMEPYGKYKAKLPLSLIDRQRQYESNLILVTAISPTPAGEGKTTTSIGLAQGMQRLGHNACVVLREPSLGPVFGMKGGAAGGGYAQVLPMEDINLHFTGDIAAIEKAHNLLAALIDNHLQNPKSPLSLDPRRITWKRVMDMNDRALRQINLGLGGTSHGIPRESGFDITVASEVMAILCLAENLVDLKERLGNILIGFNTERQPVYARDLKAQGAMAALLKDALLPNLVQTLEGGPALIHGGPFANIAQGTNSVLATKMGLSLADYVITEAGFGSDLGAEKFYNIKCKSAGLSPKASVLVATIRALKYHGGLPLDELNQPNPTAVEKGLPNLAKHLENSRLFGVPVVVAINQFDQDSAAELEVVKSYCEQEGFPVVCCTAWANGGRGAEALARAVVNACQQESHFQTLYDWEASVVEKISTIACQIYGADEVEYSAQARQHLRRIERLGLGGLPICVAKTQKSFSDDPHKKGRPRDFSIRIREIEIAAGAGFLIPIAGDIMRMPGLPRHPAAEQIDIDEHGKISGLF